MIRLGSDKNMKKKTFERFYIFFIYISSHCYRESIKGVICTILQCWESRGTWCILWCSTSFGMFSKGRYVSLGVSVYQGGCILPPGRLICQKLFVPSTGLDFPFAVPPKRQRWEKSNSPRCIQNRDDPYWHVLYTYILLYLSYGI